MPSKIFRPAALSSRHGRKMWHLLHLKNVAFNSIHWARLTHSISSVEELSITEIDCKCPPKLTEVATSIVQRCQGLPLAIVSMGSLLSSRQQTEHAWSQAYDQLRNEMSKNDHIRAILNLSYHDMPGDLRNCFLYCSMFPEDYSMSRESLVRLWVAEGFAENKDSSEPEDVAEGNLMELICRNMLEVVESDELSRVSTCKMHDIVRDLALSVAKEEMFGSASDNDTMRHLHTEVRRFSTCRWKDVGTPRSRMSFPHLRTLLSLEAVSSFTSMLNSILSASNYLTVLELQDSAIDEVPRGIVKVKKLRHLLADRCADEKQSEFRYFVGVEAPKGLSDLGELQTLETVEASKELAEQLEKLMNLALSWCQLGEDPLGVLAPHVPSLTYLRLNNMKSAKTLTLSAGSFPNLKTMVLKHMPDVNQLVVAGGALPVIEGLYIVSLPELERVPQGIETLRSLKKLWLLNMFLQSTLV